MLESGGCPTAVQIGVQGERAMKMTQDSSVRSFSISFIYLSIVFVIKCVKYTFIFFTLKI